MPPQRRARKTAAKTSKRLVKAKPVEKDRVTTVVTPNASHTDGELKLEQMDAFESENQDELASDSELTVKKSEKRKSTKLYSSDSELPHDSDKPELEADASVEKKGGLAVGRHKKKKMAVESSAEEKQAPKKLKKQRTVKKNQKKLAVESNNSEEFNVMAEAKLQSAADELASDSELTVKKSENRKSTKLYSSDSELPRESDKPELETAASVQKEGGLTVGRHKTKKMTAESSSEEKPAPKKIKKQRTIKKNQKMLPVELKNTEELNVITEVKLRDVDDVGLSPSPETLSSATYVAAEKSQHLNSLSEQENEKLASESLEDESEYLVTSKFKLYKEQGASIKKKKGRKNPISNEAKKMKSEGLNLISPMLNDTDSNLESESFYTSATSSPEWLENLIKASKLKSYDTEMLQSTKPKEYVQLRCGFKPLNKVKSKRPWIVKLTMPKRSDTTKFNSHYHECSSHFHQTDFQSSDQNKVDNHCVDKFFAKDEKGSEVSDRGAISSKQGKNNGAESIKSDKEVSTEIAAQVHSTELPDPTLLPTQEEESVHAATDVPSIPSRKNVHKVTKKTMKENDTNLKEKAAKPRSKTRAVRKMDPLPLDKQDEDGDTEMLPKSEDLHASDSEMVVTKPDWRKSIKLHASDPELPEDTQPQKRPKPRRQHKTKGTDPEGLEKKDNLTRKVVTKQSKRAVKQKSEKNPATETALVERNLDFVDELEAMTDLEHDTKAVKEESATGITDMNVKERVRKRYVLERTEAMQSLGCSPVHLKKPDVSKDSNVEETAIKSAELNVADNEISDAALTAQADPLGKKPKPLKRKKLTKAQTTDDKPSSREIAATKRSEKGNRKNKEQLNTKNDDSHDNIEKQDKDNIIGTQNDPNPDRMLKKTNDYDLEKPETFEIEDLPNEDDLAKDLVTVQTPIEEEKKQLAKNDEKKAAAQKSKQPRKKIIKKMNSESVVTAHVSKEPVETENEILKNYDNIKSDNVHVADEKTPKEIDVHDVNNIETSGAANMLNEEILSKDRIADHCLESEKHQTKDFDVDTEKKHKDKKVKKPIKKTVKKMISESMVNTLEYKEQSKSEFGGLNQNSKVNRTMLVKAKANENTPTVKMRRKPTK